MTGIALGVAVVLGVAFGWWSAVAVAIIALAVAIVRREPAVWIAGGLTITAACLGAWRGAATVSPSPAASHLQIPVDGIVSSAPVHTGQRQYFSIELSSANGQNAGTEAIHACVSARPAPVVRLGDQVRLYGEFQAAEAIGLSRRSALQLRGCETSMFASGVFVERSEPSPQRAIADLRTQLTSVLRAAAPGDAGVLLSGLVTGDDAGFSPERAQAFIRTGTTHVTAVSGSNFALVLGMLATMGMVTVGRHRRSWQAITIAGICGYAVLSGAQPSGVRAAIVAAAAVLAFTFGRRPDFPTLIILAAAAMVLVEPRQVESLGFRLSVAASLALALVLPALYEHGRVPGIIAVLAATAAAQIATLPLLLPVFGTLSLVSVPANLLIAPLIAVAMPLAALAGLAGMLWQPLGELAAAPAAMAAEATLAIVDALGEPTWYMSVGVPTRDAAILIALTAWSVIFLMSGEFSRAVQRANTQIRHWKAERSSDLPPPAPGIIRREHPANAFGADSNDAEQEPASKEDGHQVADERQRAQTVTGEIGRHAHAHHPERNPQGDRDADQTQDEPLATSPHLSDVIAAKIVQARHQ
jgi:ComEC/Rec2-related protein